MHAAGELPEGKSADACRRKFLELLYTLRDDIMEDALRATCYPDIQQALS